MTATGRPTRSHRGRTFLSVVWFGLAVVLAAAAVLSFDALRGLAAAVRIAETIAWLLPISIDAGAAVSCAVWLGGWSAPVAARFAGRMTWALLAVTVLGNATAQGMSAAGIVPPWWVAVLVGAVPPAVVGSTVHLVVLLVRRDSVDEDTAIKAARAESPAEKSPPMTVADEDLRPVKAAVSEQQATPVALHSLPPVPARERGVKRARTTTTDQASSRGLSDAEVLAAARAYASEHGPITTPNAFRKAVRVGPARATALFDVYRQTAKEVAS